MACFYDTNILLSNYDKIFSEEDKFYICNITISELEHIKSSGTKDEATKYAARRLLHLLDENQDKYEIILFKNRFIRKILFYGLPENNDSQIIATAKHFSKKNDITFVTNDLACRTLAKVVGLKTKGYDAEDYETYTGFKSIYLTDDELVKFFSITFKENKNDFDLVENQYLVINNSRDMVYKWHENKYETVKFHSLESKMFGKISPKNGDIYQRMAIDSLSNNKVTMITGHAGTGKSLLAFGYMFEQLERGNIDKIIVFCNTVPVAGAARLGFYPGSRTEKLLDSQVGMLLESKLGDRIEVENLIEEGKLVLLPAADCRGYDTTGMRACVYLTEAQNLDIELIRLMLQRIGEDCQCIIDGDFSRQVDSTSYAGTRNGMRRVSEVFKGHSIYGQVTLQNVYRSELADLAESL